MHKACTKCNGRLLYSDERESGVCAKCEVAAWTPEKRKSIARLVAIAFRKPPATEAEKDAAVAEAFKHG